MSWSLLLPASELSESCGEGILWNWDWSEAWGRSERGERPAPAPERRAVMKQTKGTQTKNSKTFNAIARLEKEFEKSAEDLGISDQVKAKLTGSPTELQKEFYYR